MRARELTITLPDIMCHACKSTVLDDLRACGIPAKNANINPFSRVCKITLSDDCPLSDKEIREKLSFDSFEKKSDFYNLCYKGLAGTTFGILLSIFPAFLPLMLINIGLSFYLAKESCLSPSQFRIRSFSADHLFTASTITMLAISIGGLFFPGLHITLLFDMSLLMLGIKNFSTALQSYIKNKTASKEEIIDRLPMDYIVKKIDQQEVSLKNLTPGDQFLLSAGALLPVNAKCTHDCLVINTIEDGETTESKTIKKGELLKQGMQLDLSSKIAGVFFTVENKYEDSYLSRINTVLQNASNPEENNKFKTIFKNILYIVLFSALITAIVSHFYFLLPWQMTLNAVICVFTSVCPCFLPLNKSLVLQTVKSKIENNKIVSTNPKLLYQEPTDIVFDFNGTLMDEPTNVEFFLEEKDEDKYKNIIYAMEENDPHIFARAICEKLGIQKKGLVIENSKKESNLGISATINNITYRIGNEKMFPTIGIEKIEAVANTQIIYIEEKGKIIGHIKFTIGLRPEAISTLQYFQGKKIKVHICTGTNKEVVEASLRAEGIDIKNINIKAEKDPFAKADYIQTLQSEGKTVIAVGDAGNDAAFLAQADIGIAIDSSGTDSITQSVATFCITHLNELKDPLNTVRKILRKGAAVKQQNDILCFGLNILAMLVPIITMGCTGLCCPVFLGPLLVLLPLLGIGYRTVRYAREQENVPRDQDSENSHELSMTAKLCKFLEITPFPKSTVEKKPAMPPSALPHSRADTPTRIHETSPRSIATSSCQS